LAIITGVTAFYSPSLAAVSSVLTVLAALCRVLLGYHFVKDVVGGLVVAGLTVGLLQYFGVFAYIVAKIS
jgi:membrane-associated phospholipid phosphatase